MADIEKFGRTFTFDDDVTPEQQETRILNWMRQNAPNELSAEPPASAPTVDNSEKKSTKGNFNPRLARVAASLPIFGQVLSAASLANPAIRDRMGDVNAYRTIAQGALPYTDEITAGVRSLLGEKYDDALADERQGLKDYADKYGEAEKTALELAGMAATLPVGIGAANAARAVPGVSRLAQLAIRYPWANAILSGGAAGAVSGFGAGEGGFENRLDNAAKSGALGAVLGPVAMAGVKGAEKAGNWLSKDNRLANYLRSRISTEKQLDPDSASFIPDAMRRLRGELSAQNALDTKPMLADLLPSTSEAVLLKPNRGSNELADALMRRQYNKDLPNVALSRGFGQHGRVEDAFDVAFGHDLFRHTDDTLLAARRANANAAFTPAYNFDIRTAAIDDALDRIRTLNPRIWETAKRWADSERRSIGPIDATGALRSYNTQFLHDIKRSMDQALGEEGRLNPKFNDMPYLSAKTALNNAMMDANSAYRHAMERYGDDSGLINALHKGRDEVFIPGSVDRTGGMDEAAIRSYLADATIPAAQKDLFLAGAARALRQNVLASNSKKFSHNWSDFLGNPETERKVEALMSGKTLGAWNLFRNKINQESANYKNAQRATSNSRTAARAELEKEMSGEDRNVLAALGLFVNPNAPSGIRGTLSSVLARLDPARPMSEKLASMMAKQGRGAGSALREVERLLNERAGRRARYETYGLMAPAVTGSAMRMDDRE